MSLYKQLWLAIIFLLTLVFMGSLVVNSLSAKSYLERQLSMKNVDEAGTLALAMTQQGTDQVMLELTLSARFDTGFYELIQFTDPQGKITIERKAGQEISDAPGWFMNLLPIEAEPGIATVQHGWNQVGTITLRSHSRFAYRELWQSTWRMGLLFLGALFVFGSLGTYLLKIILRPLDDVVRQAEAIGNRHFVSVPEPGTLEFRKVVSSMNALSDRIRQLLEEEAGRLQEWQREAHIDQVTGLLQRETFMQTLDATLHSDDVNSTGSLSLIRITGLAELNERYGRKAIDAMLASLGEALNEIVSRHSRWATGRLNGSDFGLLAPREVEAAAGATRIQSAIKQALEQHQLLEEVSLPGAATIFKYGDSISNLLTLLDGALQASHREGESRINVTHADQQPPLPVHEQMSVWRDVFEKAFSDNDFFLATFAAIGRDSTLLHFEAPVRLLHEGKALSAGSFLPWINRLEISSRLDQHVVTMALDKIAGEGAPIAVNLSVGALVEPGFAPWLGQQLATRRELADKLWLEVPESMVFRHLEGFRDLSAHVRSFGSKMGIEHIGHQLSDLGSLHDVGVDYLKVDATFIRDIDQNPANQNLLRTLCTLGHSIGVLVIAEGVRTDDEWQTLLKMGFDGATGPGIELSQS